MAALRVREDLFDLKRRLKTHQENIQEEFSIFVCPAFKKQDIKYIKVSMVKQCNKSKVVKNTLEE